MRSARKARRRSRIKKIRRGGATQRGGRSGGRLPSYSWDGTLGHRRLVVVGGFAELDELAELLRRGAARGGDAHPVEVDAVRQLVALGVVTVPRDLVIAR